MESEPNEPKDFDATRAMAYFQAKTEFTTNADEVREMIEQGDHVAIIDVRNSEDYARGHIPGAVNLPKSEWGSLGPITREKMNIFYCYAQSCHLAATAALEFASKGYPVMEMEGGFEAWKQRRYDIEIGDEKSVSSELGLAS